MMRRAWLKRWLLVGLGCFLSLTGTLIARADQPMNGTNDIGFSVAAHIPRNQVNRKNFFFDLQMKPGQAETLSVTIYNSTNRDLQIETAIHTAYTNSNGTIEYVLPTKTYDPSLKYPISELTKLTDKKTVTVPANGTKVVTAVVKMPSKQFNGIMLGGWYFKRLNQTVTGTVKGTTDVRNQYSYVIGLRYASGEIPGPDMRLKSVAAGLFDYHRGFIIRLRNVAAIMIPDVTMQTTITNKTTGAVVENVLQKNVQIAPNTAFKYPLLVNNNQLRAGKYHLHMVVKNSQHRWVFNRDFTVTQAEAQKYNRASVENRGISSWWLIVLGALLMLIIVLLIWGTWRLIKKRRQGHDETN